MYQTLLVNTENKISVITINRPDKLNALNKTVIDELSAAIDEVINNDEVRSAIITGSGSKAFVAGADISEFLSLDQKGGKDLAKRGQELVFDKIENSPKPIVAAVNGYALGGGCELAMCCHFRIASENAKFGQPEVNLGLIPGYGGTQRLVQLVGKGKAMEMLLSANLIDAHEAKEAGLVNHVTNVENLIEQAKMILSLINTKGPIAIAACIKSVNAVFNEKVNGFETEIEEFGKCFGTEDMKEGVSAFLEKRKANFKGK